MRLPSRTPAGMFTRRRLTVRTAPEPWQVGQGSSMIVPEPPQREHGWEIEKAPWPCVSTPRPSQRGQTIGVVPGFAPVPWQVSQRACIGTCSGTCAPEHGLVEGDRDLRLEVGAAFGARAPARGAAATCGAAEEVGQDVAHRGGVEVEVAEAAEAAARAGAGGEGPGCAVVLLALLGVAEHVVSLGDLLEARLGVLVVGVGVGVVLARELAVGLLDLLRRGLLVDAERLVVVGSCSHMRSCAYAATTTRAGRMTLSPRR